MKAQAVNYPAFIQFMSHEHIAWFDIVGVGSTNSSAESWGTGREVALADMQQSLIERLDQARRRARIQQKR